MYRELLRTSRLQVFFVVAPRVGRHRIFKVGSLWTGLLNPIVEEI